MNYMKIYACIFFPILSAFVCSCQHGIDPDELPFPPDIGKSAAQSDTEGESVDVEKRLKEIESVPYPPYRLQGGDRFRIRVYNEDDLNNNSTASTIVTPDGYIVMDAVGPVLTWSWPSRPNNSDIRWVDSPRFPKPLSSSHCGLREKAFPRHMS